MFDFTNEGEICHSLLLPSTIFVSSSYLPLFSTPSVTKKKMTATCRVARIRLIIFNDLNDAHVVLAQHCSFNNGVS